MEKKIFARANWTTMVGHITLGPGPMYFAPDVWGLWWQRNIQFTNTNSQQDQFLLPEDATYLEIYFTLDVAHPQ